MEYTSSKESVQNLGENQNMLIGGYQLDESIRSDFSHEPNAASYVQECYPCWQETLLEGQQRIHYAEEDFFTSDAADEFQHAGSHVRSEENVIKDAASFGHESSLFGTSYHPETTLRRQPIRDVAEESFLPLYETNEIFLTESSARSNENISNLPSFTTSFSTQEQALTNQISFRSFEATLLESDVIGEQQTPINAGENVFSADGSNEFAVTRRNVGCEGNVNATNFGQESVLSGTSCWPEINLRTQQGCNVAAENIVAFDEISEFELTGTSVRSEGIVNLSSFATCFQPPEHTLTDQAHSVLKLVERELANEQQERKDSEVCVFPVDDKLEYTSRCIRTEKNYFTVPPVSISWGPQHHPLTAKSISESGSIKFERSDEKRSCQDLLNANSCYKKRENRLECQTCKKKFRDMYSLRSHERVHTGEKPYECGTCERRFSQKCSLKRHELIHTREGSYKCKTCAKKFSSKRDLETHQCVHTREKPHECEMCKKTFRDKFDLKRHLLTHTGERPFECEICHRKFHRKSALTRHGRFVHRDELA